MVKLALAFALLAPAATGLEFSKQELESNDSMWRLYERWSARYKVARDPGEKLHRFRIFTAKAQRVYTYHLQAPGDNADKPLALNMFADLSDDEVRRDYHCRRTIVDDGAKKSNTTTPVARRGGGGTLPLPPYIDWRTKSCKGKPCLTPVKDQGPGCGSCSAFAATAALESHNAIRRSSLVQLSEQELVDCDTKSKGCEGGLAVDAFNYVTKNGLASSAAYPYTARDGKCQAADISPVDFGMRGFERVPAYDEFALKEAVGYGPVVVSIAAGHPSIDGYTGGLYQGPCGSDNDHEMLLVGYGYNYWILRNSYGEGWGAKGYMMLQSNVDSVKGMCDILMDGAVYPHLERLSD